ncbi:hypothetical protein BC830DRAFT_73346 [Chytriomyces sp. MP71]|nr:hypothetical protein BC830DRAFT_73346 [Chytriomyces sp. MP71]
MELLLPVSDPNITTEGLSIAFGHLYADYSHSILTNTLSNAATTPEQRLSLLKGVLSASCLLHLNNLATLAAELIKNDISRTTLAEYCAFVTQQTESVAPGTPSSASNANGSPQQQQQLPPSSSWVLEIRDAIFGFLCKGLVREISERRNALIWGNKGSDAYKELVAAFAELPFEWLKKVVEGREFEVPNDMERFTFAKEVVALRARRHRALKPGSTNSLVAGEENVLLAFGGPKAGGSSGVTIVRKAPKMPVLPAQQQQQQQAQQQHQQHQQYLKQYGVGAAGSGQQGGQYMGQAPGASGAGALGYSIMDQYGDAQQQQQYMQMSAQGYIPQERRVWKAGN